MTLPGPILRAAAIDSLLKPHAHPLNPAFSRTTASLGDALGLRRLGVHKTALAPGAQSTVEHFHEGDEEWFYVLSGGGTLLRAGQQADEEVRAGDFVGFGVEGEGRPHAFRAGGEGMEYLTGGTREPVDVVQYPLMGKTLVINRMLGTKTVLERPEESK
ncbi:hypothetical protein C8J57DRAFT_1290439 [Mycena rebaudengoi]|nr:hypothetical protein C8J57DRAFT_1290439 [Mycena rebaudengoi]